MFQWSESSPSLSTSVSCYLGATQGDQRQVVITNLIISLERLTIIIATRQFTVQTIVDDTRLRIIMGLCA
jgi:hypothetical protein